MRITHWRTSKYKLLQALHKFSYKFAQEKGGTSACRFPFLRVIFKVLLLQLCVPVGFCSRVDAAVIEHLVEIAMT